MFRVCHALLSVHCSLVVTCWERVNFLALLYVMFSCVFVTFPCGVLGQVRYIIVPIPDICLLTYFFCGSFCYLCVVSVMLSRLFIAALWSPAGKGLTSWLSCM